MNEQDNSKKYFSIKIGCSNYTGTPLEIDINQTPENRIKDLSDLHRIEYLPAGEYSSYVLVKKQGDEALFQMVLTNDGEIKITSNNSHAITISPILDKRRADELVERIKEKDGPSWVYD